MRHASPGITMGVYAKAVTADKREGQNAIAALFIGSIAATQRHKRSVNSLSLLSAVTLFFLIDCN